MSTSAIAPAATPALRNGGGLAPVADDGEVLESSPAPIAAFARAEIEAQVATARRFRRDIKRFYDESLAMATIDKAVAASCVYSVPRGGKNITGPSVRLAEIVAACYGNLRVDASIVGEDTRFITAKAVCLDVERNIGVAVTVRRRITDSKGKTYNDDMIGVAGAAAMAIARRNAIFATVPNAFTQVIYRHALSVAAGKDQPFAESRDEWVDHFVKQGVSLDRILARLGAVSVENMTTEHRDALIGIDTAIGDRDTTLQEAFPPLAAPEAKVGPGGRTGQLLGDLKGKGEGLPFEPGSAG